MKFNAQLLPGPKPLTWIAVIEQSGTSGRNILKDQKCYDAESAKARALAILEKTYKDITIEIVWKEGK